MSRRGGFAAATVLLLASGCFTPTWRAQPRGARPAKGVTVVVGRIAFVPAVEQYGPIPSNAILVGKYDGGMAAYFTANLSEPFDRSAYANPIGGGWTAWVPIDGWFFIEVPNPGPLHLRGFAFVTDRSSVKVEAAAWLPLKPGEPVAYIGELTVVRAGERRVSVRNRLAEARKAAAEAGHVGLLSVPWGERLAEPVLPHPNPLPR